MSRAAGLLGAAGPFAARLAGYEAREGQLRMAEAVERALADERTLICEAGTGTGKTLAYLVPALLSGRKVVVSTATRALQEQIFFKDLPLVTEALGVSPRAALVKGLSNYLCLRRYHQLRSSSEASRPSVGHKLAVVDDWVGHTDMGDVGELAAFGEDDPVIAQIASSSETRVGGACQYHAECFVTRMKREADGADLIVVNHHLFFADLALRGPHPGRVLPNYDAVIFDEAHQLEDIATAFFSVRVSQSRLERLCRDVERAAELAGGAEAPTGVDAHRLVRAARSAGERFFSVVGGSPARDESRRRLEHDVFVGEVAEAYHRLDDALDGLAAAGDMLAGRPSAATPRRDAAAVASAFDVAGRRARAMRDDLAIIVDGAPGRITWVESGRGVGLSSSPVDLAPTLRERVFESIPSVVLTSATLSSGEPGAKRPFAYVEDRLGLGQEGGPSAEPLVVASPFDYAQSTLLYVADDLPEPASPAYVDAAGERCAELVEMADGGAFVLSTSVRIMRRLHAALVRRLPGRRLFLQGEAPKATLLSSFKAAGNGVLVATASFWQGVDVPGEALRLVIIDKLPFPVPSDPIVRARGEALEEAGGNAFRDLAIPMAQIALKQGFGRLIRSRRDYGVVALLDARAATKGYGARVLRGLPPADRTRSLDDVRAFWQQRAERRGANR